MTQIKKQELIDIHNLYDEIASQLDIDYKDTKYEEFGVHPHSVHKDKDSHLKALGHLSDLVAEELDIDRISFDKSISERELLEKSGDAELYDAGHYFLRVGSSEIQVGRNSTRKVEVLEDLSNGVSLHEAVDQRYSKNPSRHLPNFENLTKELRKGILPEQYREDLETVLQEIN